METEKKDLGLPRAAFHIGFHLVAVLLVTVARLSDEKLDMILGGAWVLVALVDLFMITGYRAEQRGATTSYVRAYQWFFSCIAKRLIREKELGQFTAMMSYVTGLVFVRFVFHFSMVDSLVVMAILAWGDPFARIAGLTIESPRLPSTSKTWAGLLSFVFAAAVGVAITNVATLSAGMSQFIPRLWLAQIAGILVGAVVEVYSKNFDNFFIAFAAAFTLERMIFFLM